MQRFFIPALLLLLLPVKSMAQDVHVACWNVENLFDWKKDDVVPKATVPTEGVARAQFRKRAEIIKMLKPDILGLCEVENRNVLRILCKEYLGGEGYEYFELSDEADPRGIDVGMIAKRPFLCRSIAVPGFYRGILACRFRIGDEPVYILINHWKSRLGGGQEGRMNCAKTIKWFIEEEIPKHEGKMVPVMVMGDLNDEDDDASVKYLENNGLINTFRGMDEKLKWTIPYNNREKHTVEHNHFDHVFVNGLLKDEKGVDWLKTNVDRPSILLKPRTIDGKEYEWTDGTYKEHIGYSDHLPVSAWLRVKGASEDHAKAKDVNRNNNIANTSEKK